MNVSLSIKLLDGVTAPLRKLVQSVANANKAMKDVRKSADETFKRAGDVRHAAEGISTFAEKARGAVEQVVGAWQPFEEQMARVRALTGANGEEFEQLTTTARELGSSGRFGAVEVAKAMEGLRAEGLGVNDIITSMPLIMNAAVVSNRSLDEVIGSTTSTMDSFGLAAGDVGRILDVTSAVALASGTGVSELSAALAGVGRDAVEAGISMERVALMAGLMATKNIDSGMAAGALSIMLKALTRPAGEGAQVLSQMGVSTTETVNGVKQMRDPLTTATELMDKMTAKGIGVADQTRAMTALFSKAAPEVMALVRAAREPGMEQIQEALTNAGGATAAMAGVMKGTGLEATRNMNGALDELKRTLGEELEPVMKDIENQIEKVVRKVTGWVKEHPDLTRAIMGTAAAVAVASTAIAGLTFAIASAVATKAVLTLATGYGTFGAVLMRSFVPAIGRAAVGMWTFIAPMLTAAAPLLVITAAIAGVTAALIELEKYWGKIDFGEAWKGIKDTFAEGSASDPTSPILAGVGAVLKETFDPRAMFSDVADFSTRNTGAQLGPATPTSAGPLTPPKALVELKIDSGDSRVSMKNKPQVSGIDVDVDAGAAMGF